MKRKMRKQEVKNNIRFVAAGILIFLNVVLVSGCGNHSLTDVSGSGQKRVLSQSEIQELTDMLVTDIEDPWPEEDEDEDEEDVEGIITDDISENSHCTYVWGWEDRGEDEDDEDGHLEILAQVSGDEKILQTFSEDEIKLYPDKWAITELMGATDQELVFCADVYDDYIWYRIPLSYENGEEKVLCDKKEVIYEEKSKRSSLSCGVGKYLFCEDDKGCFILDQESGEKQRIVKDSKQLSYGYCGSAPWISPEGNIYVLMYRYQDHLADAFYVYQMGTKGVQEITEGINSESKTVFEDGKLFFTRLADGQMRTDYNIYMYDMMTGQKKVLASEEELRDILPEKPSEHADFIREMVYAQGTLYLEIRYAGQSCVISCEVDQGTLTVLEGLPELVRHREYQMPEPIENGNAKYYNVNDHNIFERTSEGVVERTLDGKYVRTLHLQPYELVYANNRELICQFSIDPCTTRAIVYSIPLTYMDGNDYPDINRKEIILDNVNPIDDTDEVRGGAFYADEKYLVYITNDHSFIVYDRQAQAFVDIAGLPKACHGFMAGNVMSNMSGENVFFNSKPESNNQFGFSLYHFGDSKVTRIDPRCYTAASAYWCGDGKTIVYESHSDDADEMLEICSYDIDTGDKRVLFTEEDLQRTFKLASQEQEIETYFGEFFASDKIYYIASALKGNERFVCSYDLAGEGELEYETQISAFLYDLKPWNIAVAEGKLFCQKYQTDEEGKAIAGTVKYYYYDLSTGKHSEFGKNDKEWGLYLSLVDLD